ncbi:MAG: hypothetical protein K1Y36_00590 [Blastocatellia bacterium]|nr:hypothetical protein [Blastocatellia bacterium]
MTESVNSSFRIRSQGFPERCEICHQTDQFDQQTGVCGRCQKVLVPLAPEAQKLRNLHLLNLDFPPELKLMLEQSLTGDERLLWVGRAYTFSSLAKQKRFLIGLFGVLLYLGFDFSAEPTLGTDVTTFLFLVSQALIVSAWVAKGTIVGPQPVLYAITNLRAITVKNNPVPEIHSVWQQNLDTIRPGTSINGAGFVVLNRTGDRFTGLLNPQYVASVIYNQLLRPKSSPKTQI